MYKIVNSNEVIRISDNKIIAPAQDTLDPDYVSYINWIKEGNCPIEETIEYPLEWEIPSDEFLAKFTEEEIAEILLQKRTDLDLDRALLELTAHSIVNNKNPLTIQLMQLLVYKRILSEQRLFEILS
jgi:hypothetical protein